MNMISLTGLTPKTWIERGDSLFSARTVAGAEPHAISFVRYAADLMPIDVLGDHAGFLLRGSAVLEADPDPEKHFEGCESNSENAV